MVCKKCGFENVEGAAWCHKCGEQMEMGYVEANVSTVPPTMPPTMAPVEVPKAKSAKKTYLGGMIASGVAVLLGLIMFIGIFTTKVEISTPSSASTTETSYSYYGGDAYTGMQQASADASNNAKAAADNVAKTNRILAETADGYNGIQDTVSRCMGLFTVALGAMGFFYFFTGYAKED